MLQFTCIGNLGSDARMVSENGRQFVSFNLAHTDKWTDEAGNEHKATQWVSCALNGDGGQLLQYLKKGKTVYVSGRGSCRVYSSPKERRMVAGLNISVDRIELLGGTSDDVPRHVYTSDGAQVETRKFYYAGADVAKNLGANKDKPVQLLSMSGQPFALDYQGYVWPVQEESQAQQTEETNQPQQ